jgi:uncharacterized membrane protein YwaF
MAHPSSLPWTVWLAVALPWLSALMLWKPVTHSGDVLLFWLFSPCFLLPTVHTLLIVNRIRFARKFAWYCSSILVPLAFVILIVQHLRHQLIPGVTATVVLLLLIGIPFLLAALFLGARKSHDFFAAGTEGHC